MKSKEVISDKFFIKIGRSLGQDEKITVSRLEISILCKDLNEVTEKDKVREVLGKECNVIGNRRRDINCHYQSASDGSNENVGSRENKKRLGYVSF